MISTIAGVIIFKKQTHLRQVQVKRPIRSDNQIIEKEYRTVCSINNSRDTLKEGTQELITLPTEFQTFEDRTTYRMSNFTFQQSKSSSPMKRKRRRNVLHTSSPFLGNKSGTTTYNMSNRKLPSPRNVCSVLPEIKDANINY